MPERPRVLHLAPDPATGGGMAAALRALLASPLADEYEFEVVPTYRSRGRPSSPTTTATGPRALLQLGVFSRALLRLAGWSLRGRGRIVHVHSTVRGSAYRKSVCVLVAKALGRRVVLQVHSGPGDIAAFRAGVGRIGLGLIGAATRRADSVIAVSGASAEALRQAGVEAEIEVVPNAAPPVTVGSGSQPPDGDSARIAYLGGFANPAKGGDVLVEALSGIPAGELPALTLAGPGEPPAGAEALLARDGIEWAGWLDLEAKDELLGAVQILVVPSRSEGMPMALLEAMSRGLAILATRVGGIPEVIESGSDGLLVEPGDAQGLAAALLRLSSDQDLRQRLGASARARAERLDAVEVSGRLGAIYRSI